MDSMTVQGDKHRIGLLVGEVKRFASSASVATRDDKYREGAPQLALYMSALWELCRTWAGILVINDCYSRSLVLGEADYKALDTTPFHGDAIFSDGDLPPLIISFEVPDDHPARGSIQTANSFFERQLEGPLRDHTCLLTHNLVARDSNGAYVRGGDLQGLNTFGSFSDGLFALGLSH
jgi:hypothetical protein